MAKRSSSQCPAHPENCRAASPRQYSASDRLKAAGVEADWVSNAMQCGYCGCVYSLGAKGKVIRGYLDDPMGPKGWQPTRR